MAFSSIFKVRGEKKLLQRMNAFLNRDFFLKDFLEKSPIDGGVWMYPTTWIYDTEDIMNASTSWQVSLEDLEASTLNACGPRTFPENQHDWLEHPQWTKIYFLLKMEDFPARHLIFFGGGAGTSNSKTVSITMLGFVFIWWCFTDSDPMGLKHHNLGFFAFFSKHPRKQI